MTVGGILFDSAVSLTTVFLAGAVVSGVESALESGNNTRTKYLEGAFFTFGAGLGTFASIGATTGRESLTKPTGAGTAGGP